MCGITGFWNFKNPLDAALLHLMTDKIAHRGPDAAGYFTQEHIGLGHRRLSIIDLSTAANQPMYSDDNRFVIVFNGEVYNFQEIKKNLNITCKTTSDTEVILQAFIQKGIEFVQLLNGMFAIAIYDKIEKKLYLFRDRLGVKPIFYLFDKDNFMFSSERKSILALKEIKEKCTVNKTAINQFLHLGYIPSPNTIYNEIKKFPSGHYAIVQHQKMEIHPFWTPESKIEKEYTTTNFNDAKKQLHELIQSSISMRMISDVPFGAFLSGGIDSSLVSAVAQKNAAQPLNTFSIGFKEATHNESDYARAVSNHLKTNHHEFIVSENEILELFERYFDAYDEPYADPSGFPTMMVSKLAKQEVTMVLTGDGGDELFQGYGMYQWAERLQNPIIRHLYKLGSPLFKFSKSNKRISEVLNFDTDSNLKSHIFSQEQGYYRRKEIQSILKPQFFAAFELDENPILNRNFSARESQALFDLKYYLQEDLMTKVDRASMQFSLESREPLLDYRIVEFSLNIPLEFKQNGNISKYILKEILYDYIPKSLFDRPKWGFSIPLHKWLKNDLKSKVEYYLSEENIAQTNLFNYAEVVRIKNNYYNGDDYLFYRVWLILVLQKWFLDNL